MQRLFIALLNIRGSDGTMVKMSVSQFLSCGFNPYVFRMIFQEDYSIDTLMSTCEVKHGENELGQAWI